MNTEFRPSARETANHRYDPMPKEKHERQKCAGYTPAQSRPTDNRAGLSVHVIGGRDGAGRGNEKSRAEHLFTQKTQSSQSANNDALHTSQVNRWRRTHQSPPQNRAKATADTDKRDKQTTEEERKEGRKKKKKADHTVPVKSQSIRSRSHLRRPPTERRSAAYIHSKQHLSFTAPTTSLARERPSTQ